MAQHDVLVLPCTAVPPFDKRLRYPSRLPRNEPAAVLDDYISWMLPCSAISLANLPAICLPFGSTSDGLPIGVQARPRQPHKLACILSDLLICAASSYGPFLIWQLVGKPNGEGELLAAARLLEQARCERPLVPWNSFIHLRSSSVGSPLAQVSDAPRLPCDPMPPPTPRRASRCPPVRPRVVRGGDGLGVARNMCLCLTGP